MALASILLKIRLMGTVMRYVLNVRRPVIAGAAGVVSIACASLGIVAALVVALERPGAAVVDQAPVGVEPDQFNCRGMFRKIHRG